MQFFELILTVYLTKDMHFTATNEILGKFISSVMLFDSELIQMHGETGFKHYCFNSLYPVEKDGIYKAGRVYIFKIRSLNETFIRKMKSLLSGYDGGICRVLSIQLQRFNNSYLSNLYTVTPAVVTMETGKNWTRDDDFIILKNRLQANLEKKYHAFFGENVDREIDMMQRIEMLNEKPMVINYKNTKFLGNKFKIWVNDHEDSQKLAFVAMACGLGEKNSSVGAGFCTGGRNG